MRLRPSLTISLILLLLAGCGGGSSDDPVAQPQAPVTPTATGLLNDTGIDWFADGSQNNLAAEPAGYEGQDASYGRDAAAAAGTLVKTGGGVAAFDFTKLDAAGAALTDQGAVYAATPWDCVRDNHTGLVWEVKTIDGGLRDKDWTYSWYNGDASTNGGSAGTANGGACFDTENCDTEKYAAAVNAAGLCGGTDWRMPTVEELRSLVDYGVAYPGPTIDTDYFANARNTWFWSASPYAGSTGYAWYVNFYYGLDDVGDKSSNGDVRLVRGGQ